MTPRPGERSPQEGLFSTEPGSLDQSGRRQARWYRSGIQRQFRSSGERHQQRLLPWSLPTKTVSSFVSFHRGATQSGILFLVSIERGTSRRVYHRRPWLSDMSQLGGALCRFFARLAVARVGVSDRRRNAAVGSCPADEPNWTGTPAQLWGQQKARSAIGFHPGGRQDSGPGNRTIPQGGKSGRDLVSHLNSCAPGRIGVANRRDGAR